MKTKLIILLLLLSAYSCNRKISPGSSGDLNKVLINHWIHSHEDDSETRKVFRPRGTQFPPSRGREAYVFRDNGEFVHHRIEPNDLILPYEGSWKLGSDSTISIEYNDNRFNPFTLRIDSISTGVIIFLK